MRKFSGAAVAAVAVVVVFACNDRRGGGGNGQGGGDGRGGGGRDGRVASALTGKQSAESWPSAQVVKPAIAEPVVEGFKLVLTKSRFARGNTIGIKSLGNGEVTSVVGSDGVFVEWQNGFSAGIPNATSPAETVPPFAYSAEPHNQRVVAYFKDAGLPEAQIGSVQVATSMRQTGTATAKNKPELTGYTTVLHRMISGVRVAGSYAWARFNANDDVVAERVWWPVVPKSEVDQAVAFAETMKTSSAAGYRAKLPPDIVSRPGEVVLRHPPPFARAWYARVVWEVPPTGGDEAPKSYDLDGKLVDVSTGASL